MSHCFGVLCRVHERVMEPASCPERGCEGHGYIYAECDDRCLGTKPHFRDLLAAAAMAAEEKFGPSTGEDRPGPDAHARLDQFLAEHNKLRMPAKDWAIQNGIQWDE